MKEIRPQPTQELFLSSSADIVIFGGSAGGGKTYALLLEPLRHISNPKFGCVIFRRESTQINNEGGLWDTSTDLYPSLQAEPRTHPNFDWRFPGGAKVSFRHLNQDKTVYAYQGSQIPLICFDELTHFSKKQFFYMLSRNRSTCGVRPYVRAGTNPDPDSWVAEFIEWWINQDTGYAISSRSGIIRWLYIIDDQYVWGDTKEELMDKHGDSMRVEGEIVPPKSVTFIESSVHDNKELLSKDPGYLTNLMSLDAVERERLLHGNWKIRPTAGTVFKKIYFEIVDELPPVEREARGWDLAATKDGGDYTAGVKMALGTNGVYYVTDALRMQESAANVESALKNTASQDGTRTTIRLPQDPGQAGKAQAENYIKMLAGYPVKTQTVTGSKVARATPASAQAEIGNIKILRGDWNNAFLTELEQFPDGANDDQVDGFSDAFNELALGKKPTAIVAPTGDKKTSIATAM